jgi:MoaA/NifB/PqqE/SkfB family radical SAM enzyme
MRPLDFPNNVQIQTTAFCNASCGFCPYPETSRTLSMGVMEEDLFRSIIDQLAGRQILLLQPFLMNEPLMDKRIVPRLAYMKAKVPGARINITTNGVLLRPALVKELVRLDLDSIHVSSNGLTSETYLATMGIDGAEVLANVNNLADELRSAGARTRLIVTALLLKQNREEVFLAREYWRRRGVEFFLNPLNDRAGNIDRHEFEGMLPFDDDVNRAQLLRYNMSGCPALYAFLGILYNGDLVTCCMDWRRSLILGNAREHSLYELWHGQPYSVIRALSDSGRLAERELCRKCGENRFSIDQESLENLLMREGEPAAGTPLEGTAAGLRIARHLQEIGAKQPDDLKLNLIRPSRKE